MKKAFLVASILLAPFLAESRAQAPAPKASLEGQVITIAGTPLKGADDTSAVTESDRLQCRGDRPQINKPCDGLSTLRVTRECVSIQIMLGVISGTPALF